MEKLVSLAKRRGFVFQSSEVYGGLGSVWDYGPLGVALKRNIKDRWWRSLVQARDDIEGLDAAILMHPRVWEASGHVSGFTDPMVDCRTCKARFRADKLADARCPQKPSKAPGEHTACDLTEPRQFNLMFKTFMGPVEESAAVIYLRPETAQGIYVNYLNVLNSSRQKIPFGIAQIGKAFRNEITPGNFIFRTREFEQMEMQFFVQARAATTSGSSGGGRSGWPGTRASGSTPSKLRWHQHGPDELAHYAKAAYDIEYEFPFGWQEIEGMHNRTDFDLRAPPGVLRQEAGVLRAGDRRALPPVRRRDVGRRRSRDAHRDGGRVPGGNGRGRDARGDGIHPADRADQGGRASAGEEGRHAGAGARALSRPAPNDAGISTTTAARSAGATAGRTKSGRRGASRLMATPPLSAASRSGIAIRCSRIASAWIR